MPVHAPQPQNIPADLQAIPQWVAYRAPLVVKRDGTSKYNKVPVNPRTGGNASSTDPETWGSFADAFKRYGTLPDAGGVGFVFTAEAGISAIDLDHCIDDDGNVHPEAAALCAAFDSFVEMSPSGNGLHIWVKGTIKGVTSAKYPPGTAGFPFGVEIFCNRFFMTVTGILGTDAPAPMQDRPAELRDLFRRLEAAKMADVKRAETPTLLTDVAAFEAEVLPKLAGLNPGPREAQKGSKGDDGHKWEVDCPWADQHSTEGGRAAVFLFAGVPGYKCLHAHCATKDYEALADRYDLPRPSFVDEFNRDHALVMIEGKVRIVREDTSAEGVPDYTFMAPRDFQTFYSNRNRTVKTGQNKSVTVNEAREWMNSENRRTYTKVTFDPSGKVGRLPGVYNMFRGFGVQPKAGDWSLMAAHIRDIVCGGDDAIYRWVTAWCARVVQDPGGERPGTAIVLRGGQGTGKGMFANNFGRIIGPHFKHLTHQEQLTRTFNAHLKDALLVFADEACYPGDKAAVGRLKGMITEPTMTIEPKGVDAFELPCHINLIMASNEQWMIPADLDSRRFLCLEVSDGRQRDRAYFAALQRQMDNGGLEAWLYDLLCVDWAAEDLRNPPETEALQVQKVQSLSPIPAFWHTAIENEELPLADADGKLIGGIGWPDVAAKGEVWRGYVRFCKERGYRHPGPESIFWKQLRAWGCADGGRGKDGRKVTMPPHNEAEAAWKRELGGKRNAPVADYSEPF